MRTTGVDSVLILDNGLENPEYLVLLCSSLEILKKPCTLPESLTLPVLHYGCASTVDMARDVTYPLVPVINFLGVFLVLLPFSTRTLRQRWNTGICMYAIYVATMCLFLAVDTIVWANNFNIISPVWCDIGKLRALL